MQYENQNEHQTRKSVLVPTMYVGCSLRWSGTMDGKRFQYPRCTWVVVQEKTMTILMEKEVLVPAIYVGCSRYYYEHIYSYDYVLVPTMYVGCSSEICTKAVSLCSYFITMCCICQVLFPINFRFFILFFCSICFSSDFLVRIPLFHPSNRCENLDFRGTIFLLLPIKM